MTSAETPSWTDEDQQIRDEIQEYIRTYLNDTAPTRALFAERIPDEVHWIEDLIVDQIPAFQAHVETLPIKEQYYTMSMLKRLCDPAVSKKLLQCGDGSNTWMLDFTQRVKPYVF